MGRLGGFEGMSCTSSLPVHLRAFFCVVCQSHGAILPLRPAKQRKRQREASLPGTSSGGLGGRTGLRTFFRLLLLPQQLPESVKGHTLDQAMQTTQRMRMRVRRHDWRLTFSRFSIAVMALLWELRDEYTRITRSVARQITKGLVSAREHPVESTHLRKWMGQ